MAGEYRTVLSASKFIGGNIENPQGEKLGKLEDIMIDYQSGKIAYAILSFGGFLGLGEKLFALPWNKLRPDQSRECFILNASKEKLKEMPGFDKSNWPDMTDIRWQSKINSYYENF
jgi:sporulation protein YlmC with PRC-barrel domain